ncbi:MAG: AraC family transcriptional regulator [Cyclobacteriaceae bacterium]|nr:AraC family transcriptional regulator [Cyclobacteriaceae bacterium]
MVEYYPLTQLTNAAAPQRVRKYLLVWCGGGQCQLEVDGRQLIVPAHHALTITSGQVHGFREVQAASGGVLYFTLDFFSKDDTDLELIFHNGLFCHFDLNEIIPVQHPAVIESQLELIREELERTPYQYVASIHARIQLMLIEINRSKMARGDEVYKPDALFLRFLELIRSNFEQNITVAEAATRLLTTVARLNQQAKQHTGRTAQQVIHGLVAAEAKRIMWYEHLSVKETAFRLGFKDPFYFSHFFKKQTGQSPKAFHASGR